MLDLFMLWEVAYRSRKMKPVGILNHWRSLRERLMNPTPLSEDDQWVLPEIPKQWDVGKESMHSAISALRELHHWLHASAKIYAITEAQQREWLDADYSTLRWCDLHFPQSSFFVELPKPIAVGGYQAPCSVVLFEYRSTADTHTIRFRFFETREVFAELSRHDRRRILNEMERGQIQNATQTVERIVGGRCKTTSAHNFFNIEINPDGNLITEPDALYREVKSLSKGDSVPPSDSSAWQHLSTTIKSIIGFVWALKLARPAERSERRLSRKDKDVAGRYELSPVTEGVDFCQLIGAGYKYLGGTSADQRNITTGREQDPQNRDGYWRRRHGEGNNPDAPRRWVNAYTTRKDKIEKGILPKPKRVKVQRKAE